MNSIKEKLIYLLFGVLTTVVSFAVFALFTDIIPLDPLIANVISWFAAVAFAFVTNRKWVFESDESFFKQIIPFYLGRFSTFLFEEASLLVFVTWLHLNDMLIKTLATMAVIILNYIISKKLVFKK